MPIHAQVCTWIAMAALLAPSAAAGQDRTERELVEVIMRDGPQARAIRAAPEVTRQEHLARLAYPNPTLTYSREGAGFTEFLQIEQSLPVFGIRAALSRAGVAATEAADAERDVRLGQLRSEVAEAVARMVAEQGRLELARSHATEVGRLVEILRTREREGEGSRFDRLRVEQELRDLNQLIATIAGALALARAEVSGMLPADTPLTRVTGAPVASQPLPQPETLLTRAMSTRAELRALQKQGQRATIESDIARRSRLLPSPTLIGGLKRADDVSGRERGGVLGLSLALPLFDPGRREAARWDAEHTRIDAERAWIESRIRSQIAGASEVLAVRQLALSQDEPGAAGELAQIAEVAYREGEVGVLDLVDAVRTVLRARTRSIDLALDARLAQIALERAVGDTLWP